MIIPVLIALMMFQNAHASLVKDGLELNDDVSGLSWLDLTYTINNNYTDIQSLLASDSNYAGKNNFRLATETEVNGLFTQVFPSFATNTTATLAGADNNDVSYFTDSDGAYATEIERWFELMGQTPAGDYRTAYGLFLADDGSLEMTGASRYQPSGDFTHSDYVYGAEYDKNYLEVRSFSFIGWFLVNDFEEPDVSVPEPGTGILLVIGVFGLAASRKWSTMIGFGDHGLNFRTVMFLF